MNGVPTIDIVDDDDAFREAMGRLLRAAGYNVSMYSNAGEYLVAGVGDRTACILLDVCMPGPSGLQLQEALARRADSPPVIFLSGHGDIGTAVDAMKAGAIDFLTKPVERETLLSAVRRALAGYQRGRAERERLHAWRCDYETLTPREKEVFSHVAAGKLNKEIAAELGACERTVKAHRASVMQKMHVVSLTDLVEIAIGLGMRGTSRVESLLSA